MRTLLFALIAICMTSVAPARADVVYEVAPRETWVGRAVNVSIEFKDVDFEIPTLPELEWATVAPYRRSTVDSTNFNNGRLVSSKTVTLTFPVTLNGPGEWTIPAFDITADGETYRTQPVTVVARQPVVADRLRVEVTADRDSVYVGEAVELTLSIFIKPFEYETRPRRRMSEDIMWTGLSDSSRWGVFLEPLKGMVTNRRRPRGADTFRQVDGAMVRYYEYRITRRVWPHRAGPYTTDDIVIVFNYPASARRGDTIPLSVTARPPALNVLPIPSEGRPASFNGALGQYRFKVDAKPKNVSVGDPITLTMLMIDETNGRSQLQTLPPPGLQEIEALRRDFRMPADDLAGEVDGPVKRFTQLIRPVRDDVTEIPSIPFAFFNPDEERFEVVWSDPIPITVRKTSTVGRGEVVEASDRGDADDTTLLTETAGGIVANHAEVSDLLDSQELTIGWIAVALLAVPPLLFTGGALTQRHRRRLRDDPARARRRGARRRAARTLAEAAQSDQPAEAVGAAIGAYVADRCNLPPGAVTRADVVRQLEDRSVDGDVVRAVADLLAACDRSRYAGTGSDGVDELARKAESCLDRLERERLQ